jgi:Ser/Thr protein kinase RdoA (MazF antagonist)
MDLTSWRRPTAGDEAVIELLDRVGVDVAGCVDIGGTMSLNLHDRASSRVIRIHPRFVDQPRLRALGSLRRHLDQQGVGVAPPIAFDRAGEHLVEIERFVPTTKPAATWASYTWMFRAMGRLHRASLGCDKVPDPAHATYATPAFLRQELAWTGPRVAGDAHASAFVDRLAALVDRLEPLRPPEDELTQLVVHGDVRLGNVVHGDDGRDVFFDFGFAAVRPRVHDLAYSLSWIVLQPTSDGRAETTDWDAVRRLVTAYEQEAGPLDPVERDALDPYLAAVPLYLAAIAGRVADPVAHLAEEAPFVDIAAWVIDRRPLASSPSTHSPGTVTMTPPTHDRPGSTIA